MISYRYRVVVNDPEPFEIEEFYSKEEYINYICSLTEEDLENAYDYPEDRVVIQKIKTEDTVEEETSLKEFLEQNRDRVAAARLIQDSETVAALRQEYLRLKKIFEDPYEPIG